MLKTVKNIKSKNNLPESLVFIAVTLGLFLLIPSQIPHVERTWGVMQNLPGGPRLFPYISIGMIGVFSVIMLIRSLLYQQKVSEKKRQSFYDGDYKAFILTALAWTLYALAVTYIGYIVSSFVLLIALMKWYGVKSWPKVIMITSGVTVGLYFLFVEFMKLPFSRSPLLF